MNKYYVKLNGRNFIYESDKNGQEKLGFLIIRYVEAENPEEAEMKAVSMVRKIERLKFGLLNTKDNPPMIYLEDLAELESFDGINNLEPGIIFYNEDKDEDDDNAT